MTDYNKQKDFVITITALGGSDGIKRVRATHWSGLCVVCPRALYPQKRTDDEFKKSGVYLLVGEDENDPGKKAIYIGQAGTLGNRLNTHYGNMDFWQQVAIFISESTNPLNSTMSKYIESKLIEQAGKGGYTLMNTNASEEPTLSIEDRITCDRYLDEMMPLLPIIGIEAFVEETTQKPNKANKYLYAHNDKDTKGYRVEGSNRFVVLKGSKASKERSPNITKIPYYARLFMDLDGIMDDIGGGYYRFKENHEFNSPSQAASFIAGSIRSGNEYWKTENGEFLSGIRKREVEDKPAKKKPQREGRRDSVPNRQDISNGHPLYFYASEGREAKGYRVTGSRKFVVTKGSKASKKRSPSVTNFPADERVLAEIKEQGILDDSNANHYVFKEKYEFNSSSQAASFITGSKRNGNTFWKTENGETLLEILNKESKG